MSGVKEQLQATPLRDPGQRFHIARVAPQMDAEYASCPRTDQRFNLRGIKCEGLWIDICEHRLNAKPTKNVGGCHERERRDDDLTVELQSTDRNFKADGRICRGDTVAGPCLIRYPLFELFNIDTRIGQPATVEQIVHALEQSSPVADIRPPNVQRFLKCWRATEKSQIAHGQLGVHALRALLMRA